LCPCLEMCYLRRRFEEQFADFAGRTYIGEGCEIVSLEADIQIIPFSL